MKDIFFHERLNHILETFIEMFPGPFSQQIPTALPEGSLTLPVQLPSWALGQTTFRWGDRDGPSLPGAWISSTGFTSSSLTLRSLRLAEIMRGEDTVTKNLSSSVLSQICFMLQFHEYLVLEYNAHLERQNTGANTHRVPCLALN